MGEEIWMQENKGNNAETEKDIDAVIAILDQYTQAGDSRIKINVVKEENMENRETISRQYHHGRCDVGSPWARGTAFDVLE